MQPTLSIWNVGQIIVDLLISSIMEKRVAYLDEPSVLPYANNAAFRSDAMVTDMTMEV
jgi:proteasome assembly chaperone 2